MATSGMTGIREVDRLVDSMRAISTTKACANPPRTGPTCRYKADDAAAAPAPRPRAGPPAAPPTSWRSRPDGALAHVPVLRGCLDRGAGAGLRERAGGRAAHDRHRIQRLRDRGTAACRLRPP